ncbi:MAG: hypothetical protein WCA21_21065 [Terracidiphilus sp.]
MFDPIESAASGFVFQVERFYAALISAVNLNSHGEPGLGGRLLYAGELEAEARALLVAANIAGAASLVVSADAVASKQAMHHGVVDFLVNSLDEALRILKNEIRKRETVAVCVAAAPEAIVEEMRERGVIADLSRPIEYTTVEAGQSLLVWSVADSSAAWLRELDAVALDCMDSKSASARRWLRLAPRYLGRMAQGVRVLRCNQEAAARLQEEIRARVADGRIPVPVELRHSYPAASIRFQSSFTP